MTSTACDAPVTGQPGSLRSYLMAGGDPTALDGWTYMAEAVCSRREHRQHSLHFYTSLLAQITGRPSKDEPLPLRGQSRYLAAVRLRSERVLELLDNEALAARFELALPVEVVAAHREGRSPSRAAVSRLHAHP